MDDDWWQAKLITVAEEPQTRNFHTSGDEDYVKFVGEQTYTYTIETLKINTYNDTVLTLYDTDGTSQLAYNDDDLVDPSNAPFSRIDDWYCETAGTYYIRVAHHALEGGCGEEYQYKLEITRKSASGSLRPAGVAALIPGLALARPAYSLPVMAGQAHTLSPSSLASGGQRASRVFSPEAVEFVIVLELK